MSAIHVRRAVVGDARAAVELLRASIIQLCVDDHHNDPHTLALWLRNKTSLAFSGWLADPGTCLVVAENPASILGVGMIAHTGRVNLLYVRPGFQQLGVGRALLGSLEAHAAARQVLEITLKSSSRARSFYERQGYDSAGPPEPGVGVVQVFPYAKTLRR